MGVSEVATLDDVASACERVVAALREGEVAVIPTDTVYALVADAFSPKGTAKLAEAKGREREVPVSVFIRSHRQAAGLAVEIPETAERLMAAYWPGLLTLVFAGQEGLTWDVGETQGTVALRMPTDELSLAVAAEVGPLAVTGAKLADAPQPISAGDIQDALGPAVALYVDGGRRSPPGSTVVDVTRPGVTVLREGAVPAADVQRVASGAVPWGARPDENTAAPASGSPDSSVGAAAENGAASDEHDAEPEGGQA